MVEVQGGLAQGGLNTPRTISPLDWEYLMMSRIGEFLVCQLICFPAPLDVYPIMGYLREQLCSCIFL